MDAFSNLQPSEIQIFNQVTDQLFLRKWLTTKKLFSSYFLYILHDIKGNHLPDTQTLNKQLPPRYKQRLPRCKKHLTQVGTSIQVTQRHFLSMRKNVHSQPKLIMVLSSRVLNSWPGLKGLVTGLKISDGKIMQEHNLKAQNGKGHLTHIKLWSCNQGKPIATKSPNQCTKLAQVVNALQRFTGIANPAVAAVAKLNYSRIFAVSSICLSLSREDQPLPTTEFTCFVLLAAGRKCLRANCKIILFFNGPFTASFSLFRLFNTVDSKQMLIKSLPMP